MAAARESGKGVCRSGERRFSVTLYIPFSPGMTAHLSDKPESTDQMLNMAVKIRFPLSVFMILFMKLTTFSRLYPFSDALAI